MDENFPSFFFAYSDPQTQNRYSTTTTIKEKNSLHIDLDAGGGVQVRGPKWNRTSLIVA